MELSPIEQRIVKVLRSATAERPCINPTELYCEGWLTRLALTAAEEGIECFPFTFAPGARWSAEARLYTAFKPTSKSDRRGETHTHADGVVGHFHFGTSKSGVHLSANATQFITLEAKVFSSLSKGTKNAEDFGQAARYVGCMAEILRRAGRHPSAYESLGFYLIAPRSEIDAGRFWQFVEAHDIETCILARIAAYPDSQERMKWYEEWVQPLMEHLQVSCVTWEQVIERITSTDAEFGASLNEFYGNCLRFNGKGLQQWVAPL